MTLKDDAARVAVLTAVRDAIDTQLRTMRQTVFHQLNDAHATLGVKSIDVTLPDGTQVASVTIKKPKPRTVVTNTEALTEWVQARHPDEVIPTVRPAFLTALLARFVPTSDGTGDVFDATTGELVNGVTAYPAKEPDSFALTWTTAGRGQVADAWRNGDLADLAGTPPKAIEAT